MKGEGGNGAGLFRLGRRAGRQALSEGEGSGLNPVIQVELFQDVLEVVLHRAGADPESSGDLFVRGSAGHQA